MNEGPPDPHGYELAPSRFARRSSRSAVLVAALGGLILGCAVVAAIAGGISGQVPVAGVSSPVARAPASPVASPGVSEASHAPVAAVVLPLWVTCHDLLAQRCRRLAQAAVDGLDDPTLSGPSSVEVWSSIVCGSTFDCPPIHLDGRHPAGSVVVTFRGTVKLWVNVTEADRGLAGGPGVRPLEVWVIQSQPAG